jgi:hypothetical protein
MKKILLVALFFISTNALSWPIDTYRTQTSSELFKPKGELVEIEVPVKDFMAKQGMARVRIDVFEAQGVGWGNPLKMRKSLIASLVVNNEIVGHFNYSNNIIYLDIEPGKQNIGVYQVAGNSVFTGEFFVNKGDGFDYNFEEGKSYSMTFSKQDFGVYKLSVNDVKHW